jgi:hypothetical protein
MSKRDTDSRIQHEVHVGKTSVSVSGNDSEVYQRTGCLSKRTISSHQFTRF